MDFEARQCSKPIPEPNHGRPSSAMNPSSDLRFAKSGEHGTCSTAGDRMSTALRFALSLLISIAVLSLLLILPIHAQSVYGSIFGTLSLTHPATQPKEEQDAEHNKPQKCLCSHPSCDAVRKISVGP